MKKFISIMLAVIMVLGLFPFGTLAQTEEASDKVTVGATNDGVEAVDTDASVKTNATQQLSGTYYQKVDDIDDTDAKYLIVYEGDDTPKVFTATQADGSIQGSAANAVEGRITQLGTLNGDGVYEIKKADGSALTEYSKWYFSSTTTDAQDATAVASYIQNASNRYYLQGNTTQDEGRYFKLNPTSYTGLTSVTNYAIDTLMLRQYPVSPYSNGSYLWQKPVATAANEFTIEQLAQAAKYIVDTQGYYMTTYPTTVTVAGTSMDYIDYYMMMCKAVVSLNGSGTKSTIIAYDSSYNVPSKTAYFSENSSNASKANYVAWAQDDIDRASTESDVAPNSNGPVDSNSYWSHWAMAPLYTRILSDMYTSGTYTLPSTAYIDSGFGTYRSASWTATYNSTSYTYATSFTIRQIADAALKANKAYTGGGTIAKLTSATKTIGNVTVDQYELYYMMNRAIYDIYNTGVNATTTYDWKNITTGTSTTDMANNGTISTGSEDAITKQQIMNLVSRGYNWFVTKSKTAVSNYAGTGIYNDSTANNSGTVAVTFSTGWVSYVRQWLLFARTLAYYAKNKALPASASIRTGTYTTNIAPTSAPSATAPTAPPVNSDDSHIPTAIPNNIYQDDAKPYQDCMLVIPRASNKDADILSLPSADEAVNLEDGLFLFAWWRSNYYYRTSYIRYTDGRYGDRFVFSPSRIVFTQLKYNNKNGNILQPGTRFFQSNFLDGGVDIDGDGKNYQYILLYNDYSNPSSTGNNYTAEVAEALPDAFSAFLHFMRPSYMTVYKEVENPTVTLLEEEEAEAPKLSSDDPLYPEAGSTNITKTAKGVNWEETGVAEVELGVEAVGLRQYTDFVMILDNSKSVWFVNDVDVGSTEAAPKAMASWAAVDAFADVVLAPNQYTGEASNNRIAVVSFNYYAKQLQDFTSDPSLIKAASAAAYTYYSGSGATNYDDAFRKANAYLASRTEEEKATRNTVIIFLTDGAPSFYNDNHGWNSWAVADGGIEFTGTESSYTYGQDGKTVPAVGYTRTVCLWYGALGIDPAARTGARLDDNSRWQKTGAEGYESSITYRFLEDSFMYSSMTSNGASETTWSNDGREAQMMKRMVLNSTHMYSDKTKEEYGAEIHVVGLDVASGSTTTSPIDAKLTRWMNNPPIKYTGEECEAIITSIASDEDHIYLAESSDLVAQFEEIAANYIIPAATEAVVTDTLGVDYDLKYTSFDNGTETVNPTIVLKQYSVITRDMIGSTVNGEVVTEAHIGNRITSTEPTVLETITLTGEGNATSSAVSGDIWTGDASTGTINGKYIKYDFATEEFTWTIGTFGETEYALTYNVYLTGSLEGTRPRGTYPTNEIATLSYVNADNNNVSKDFPIPELAWGGAVTRYEYYLVNSNGIPVNFAGQTVGTEARVVVYGPISKDLNLFQTSGSQAINASDNLPKGYTLYNPNTSYEVTTGVGGSVTIVDNGSPKTTLLINDNPDNSYVAFAVVYNQGALNDFMVLDFDKKVQLDVTKNDIMQNPKLVGLALNTVGDAVTAVEYVPASGQTIAPTSTPTTAAPTTAAPTPTPDNIITIAELAQAAKTALAGYTSNTPFYESGITVGGITITQPGYYIMCAQAIQDINNNKTTVTYAKDDYNKYGQPNLVANYDLKQSNATPTSATKALYMNYAIRQTIYVTTGAGATSGKAGASASYPTTDSNANGFAVSNYSGQLTYEVALLMFTRVLAYYADNGTLPTSVALQSVPTTYQSKNVKNDLKLNVGNNILASTKATDLYSVALGSTTNVKPTLETAVTGLYGNASIVDGKVQYEMTQFLDGNERLFCWIQAGANDLYSPSALWIMPATNVYYEDTFATDSEDSNATKIYFSGDWSTVGTSQDEFQSSNGELYGFDSSYADDTGDSNGSSKVLISQSTNLSSAVMSFVFRGTGFDIVSRTTTATGKMLYRVSNAETGKIISQKVVDTIYKSGELYQIPVLSWETETHGTYKVELFAFGSASEPQTIYVDGIRIYNPIGKEDADYQAAQNAYITHSELNPMVFEIRPLLFAGETGDEMSQAVFIDGTAAATARSDAYELGPNNELYLGKNQTLTFSVTTTELPSSIQMGAKSPYGQQVTFTATSAGVAVPLTQKLTSATNMYYNITNGLKVTANADGTYTATVIITNVSEGDAILSITDIKVVVGKTSTVEISTDQQLIDAAIAYTDKVKTEGVDGEIIVIIGGTEYENGKIIKSTSVFNFEKVSKKIFENISAWYFSYLR